MTYEIGTRVKIMWLGDKADGCIGVVRGLDICGYVVEIEGFDGHNGEIADGKNNRWFVDEVYLQPFTEPAAPVAVPTTPVPAPVLPTEAAVRKSIPIGSGVLDYFPNALIEIAKVSKAGNDQHNPGQPLHWARDKSTDHSDTIIRHWMERGSLDEDGQRHSAKLAWRSLALLQMELEAAGAPKARGAK